MTSSESPSEPLELVEEDETSRVIPTEETVSEGERGGVQGSEERGPSSSFMLGSDSEPMTAKGLIGMLIERGEGL